MKEEKILLEALLKYRGYRLYVVILYVAKYLIMKDIRKESSVATNVK